MLVGARSSPLSQAQVAEVAEALKNTHPHIQLKPIYLESFGDKDRKTSLRTLAKTDFFTREIDQLLLSGGCRIAIHSAKDLPESIPDGLMVVALTKGLDTSDVLVMKPGMTLAQLPKNATIATSSERREEAVGGLRGDLRFIDLRGTIGERLLQLERGEADGIVVAEAALLRLGLSHLNRITLPGSTTPYQGQLAILARESDAEMFEMFDSLDCRPRVLFTGLEAPRSFLEKRFVHFPLIQIVPRPRPVLDISPFTHVVFGSKNGVRIALEYFPELIQLQGIAVGKATGQEMSLHGFNAIHIAEREQTEGIVELIDTLDLRKAHLLWPHSASSRPLLKEALIARNVQFHEWIAYDTRPFQSAPLPDLFPFSEIAFTSTSTVEAFANFFGDPPSHLKLNGIGPITDLSIAKYFCNSHNKLTT